MQQQFNSAKFEDMSHHTTHKQVILSDKKERKNTIIAVGNHITTHHEKSNSQSPKTTSKQRGQRSQYPPRTSPSWPGWRQYGESW